MLRRSAGRHKPPAGRSALRRPGALRTGAAAQPPRSYRKGQAILTVRWVAAEPGHKENTGHRRLYRWGEG
ncbi:MAG: hypothetical protein WCN98_05260, partial [Verrucomicrobiaceae bacterium]